MALPTNVNYGQVVGQFISAVGDSNDVDRLPDSVVPTGTIIFTPSVSTVVNATASTGPVTISLNQITCTLDNQGYLLGPDSTRGVYLVATDDGDLNPSNWTYSVSIRLSTGTLPAFSISLPTNSTIDLSLVVPVSASTGSGLPQAEAAAAIAASAAQEAEDTAEAMYNRVYPTNTSNRILTIDSVLSLPTDVTAKLRTDAGIVALETDVKSRYPVITPESFGAVGDGIVDDSTAVQSAMSAITTGKTVLLTKNYRVTTPINITSKTDFSVEGGGKISYAGTTTSVNGAVSAMSISGCTGFLIEGFTVDILTQNQMYNAIRISTSSRGVVRKTTIKNARWAGISVFDGTAGTSSNVVVEENTIEYCRYGVSLNGKWCRVSRNHIASYWLSSSEAASPWTSSSIHWDGIILGGFENVVDGNTFIEPGQSGIYGGGTLSSCTIVGNMIVRAQNKGIDIGPTSGGVATYITVTGNTIVDSVTGDIHFYRVNDSVISGNTCIGTANTYFGAVLDRPGIILNDACLRNSVTGNTVVNSGATREGIFVNGTGSKSTGNVLGVNKVTAVKSYLVNTIDNRVDTAAQPGLLMASGLYYTAPGGVNTSSAVEAKLRAHQVVIGKDCTLDRLACSVLTAGSAGAVIRLGIYADAGDVPGSLLLDAGTVSATVTGVLTATINLPITAGTKIWLAAVAQGGATTTPVVRQTNGFSTGVGDSSAAAIIDNTLTAVQSTVDHTGALPTTATWIHGTNATRCAIRAA